MRDSTTLEKAFQDWEKSQNDRLPESLKTFAHAFDATERLSFMAGAKTTQPALIAFRDRFLSILKSYNRGIILLDDAFIQLCEASNTLVTTQID